MNAELLKFVKSVQQARKAAWRSTCGGPGNHAHLLGCAITVKGLCGTRRARRVFAMPFRLPPTKENRSQLVDSACGAMADGSDRCRENKQRQR